MAQIAEKEARALLKHLASDPHLRIVSKSIVPYLEQYPHTWDHQLKNVRTTESSLKHALQTLEFDESTSNLPKEVKELMAAGKADLLKAIGFECTTETPKSTLEYNEWRYRVTNLILDAVNACFKKNNLMGTDTLKMLFTGSETKTASGKEAEKALGYSFANEVLVDHPYRWDPAIKDYITDIIENNSPGLAAKANNYTDPTNLSEECMKAQDLVMASEKALAAQIRKLQKINSHTLLVLMPWLIPKAREDESPLFSRLKGHRAAHIASERLKDEQDRIVYDGIHLLSHLESLYTVANVVTRHTAWTEVLLGNRAPGVTLYEWLNHMDAVSERYINAGTDTQIRDGLNHDENKALLAIIGKQISDYEEGVLLKVAPEFGENKLSLGNYDLDRLKRFVAENVMQVTKHKFKYCSRIRQYVQHTYNVQHNRPLPDHMLEEHMAPKKKHKSDQLNFESETKTNGFQHKSWSPNPNQKKGRPYGPFGSGYGRGLGNYKPNRWNHSPSKGKYGKGKKGKDKGKGRGKGHKGKKGKGKGKSNSSKGKNSDRVCHHCGLKGHLKADCFKYKALQGNDRYQKAKAKHPPRVQLCIEILEDAVDMNACEHCFQHGCTPHTCFFPPSEHEAMQEAHSLFFNSDMYDTCLQTKTNSWYTPHTNDDWYDPNTQTHEEARGYWHDYEGYSRESLNIEVEDDGWYTEEWFNTEEERVKKKSKQTTSSSSKVKFAEEASSGSSSEE